VVELHYTGRNWTRIYLSLACLEAPIGEECKFVHQVGILDNWRDPQMSEAALRKEKAKKERVGEILRAE